MSDLYINPISPLISLGPQSVQRNKTFGTDFSILGIGGYMEVYSQTDLLYTIPTGQTGVIEFTGNTIPIQFTKGTGSPFSFDVLTLNSDNISSGRRRLGMLSYVYGDDQVYQFRIDNYDTLWNNATGATGTGGATVVISNFGTTVKGNSPEGIAFISAWTSNTIEGVSGETHSSAVWKKYYTGVQTGTCFTDLFVDNLEGCTPSGITLSSHITPVNDGTINLGTSITRFRDINTLSGTTSYWTATTKVITPELDLGLDSLSNQRTITANSSIIQNDTLLGGTF